MTFINDISFNKDAIKVWRERLNKGLASDVQEIISSTLKDQHHTLLAYKIYSLINKQCLADSNSLI